jgi:phospholipid/cholesterol/gamma-HCH transport system substrate-binding protein
MLKHFEGAKLGIFIFIGTILIIVAVFLVGNKESVFTKNVYIHTYFDDVAGLRKGASVRLSGLNIGNVSDIYLVPDTTGRVEVTMRIRKELRKFIRLDSRASIETEGLIGSKIVSISPGSPYMEIVKDGGIIPSQEPISLTRVIQKTQGVIGYLQVLTKNLAEIVQKVNKGEGTIGKVVNDDELYYATVRIVASADTSLKLITSKLADITNVIVKTSSGVSSIVGNVDSSVADIKNLVKRVQKGEGVLGALISDRSTYDSLKTVIDNLVVTTKNTKEGAQAFIENMEALKHNWLFKDYFERRGYWSAPQYERKINNALDSLKRETERLNDKIRELKKMKKKL